MNNVMSKRVISTARSIVQWRRSFSTTDMEDETGNKYEKSLNRVQIIGRLGRDAELRGSDQRSVVVLSVATNDVYTKQSGERVSHVDWHRISVFQPNLRDKIAINLKKGDRVFLAGKIRYDEYRDNDNVLRRSASILADDIINITKRYEEDVSEEVD